MDLQSRIRRRAESSTETRLIQEYEPISPVAHIEEPIGRGAIIERMLDYLEPIFDGQLPSNAYIWGPAGSGKSAIVTALFRGIRQCRSHTDAIIHTATRVESTTTPALVYVDCRTASTEFGVYQSILDAVLEDVPKNGVGTERLRDSLQEYLGATENALLVAFDHVDEPGAHDLATLERAFDDVADDLSWMAIARVPPTRPVRSEVQIELPAYRDPVMVDILTQRASNGLAHRAIAHEQLREIAAWSDGNAHDALCALFCAADIATATGTATIRDRDLHAGMDSVPKGTAALGRVLALAENRRRVLHALIESDQGERAPIETTATSIADHPDVALSPSTVKRLLYELADNGIAHRVQIETTDERAGRTPSTIEPRFPTRVFRRLDGLSTQPSVDSH
ncbi:Cdc6/Cdc18 family protein [Halocatena halophila]|uniref:Cdc6/Cdc18 family protein n=1 Tax=Halocatena halophila TaxID=2814576 RepID=UPI002ED4B297